MRERTTYMMHNFKVIRNKGQYRVCLHPYKFIFIGVTIIREVELHDVPFKIYEFVEFCDIIRGNFERGLLVGRCWYGIISLADYFNINF